jgi:mannosylglycerate hydrolase
MLRTPPYESPDFQPKETQAMQKTVRYKLHVVSHTHWDREWYSPFQQFRQRLVRLTDRLLELMERNPDFRYFVFDGQAIILEDYFEIRPENRDRLKALVQGGRIEIGPWYVLPDEFLVSGESLIRNLQIGHRLANEYGGAMKVGYMPDSFGHIAQMPQILRGFNIDNFIFTRGLGDEEERLGTEFLWIAPDGNRVLAIYQLNGYCNGADLGIEGYGDRSGEAPRLDTLIDRLHEQIAQMGKFAKIASDGSKHILINNGCDHQEPQLELPRLLNYANAVVKDCTIEQTTFSRFIHTVRRSGLSLPNFSGEMHGSKRHFILSGVLSSRVYLKQRNDACETLLAHLAEPLATLAWLRTGVNHASGLLAHAWKTLLKNHPHDSICGCSIDLVHREMLPRFDEAGQIGENVIDATLESLTQRVRRPSTPADWPAFVVVNPLVISRKEVIRSLVLLPPKTKPKTLAVVDSDDRPLPAHVMKVWPLCSRDGYVFPEAFMRLGQISGRPSLSFETKRAQLLEDRTSYNLAPQKKETPWYVAEIEFLTPEMAPVSYRTFSVRSAVSRSGGMAPAPVEAAPTWVRVKGNVVENAYLRAKFYPDGSFDLFDKAGKRQFKRCHIFEDVEDVGDEYDYSPAARSQKVSSRGKKGKLRVVHRSAIAAEVEVSLSLALPAEFDRARRRRSAKMIRCPLHIRFTVTATTPYVAVRTTFENLARDHRLGVHFAAPIRTATSLAGQQFYVVERPLKKPSGKNWRQAPGATEPMQHFCALADRKGGVALLTQGLYEYEARRESKGASLILTLLRSVGWLSRGDLATRPGNAGPSLPAPEAQCPGTQEFHYAIMPYTGGWEKANLPLSAQCFRVPLLEKPCPGPGGNLPADFSLFRAEPNFLVVTAIKKCDHRDTVIVRLYNASSQRFKGKLFWSLPVAHAWKVNLLEERLEEVTVLSNSRVDVDFPAWRILTLELEMSKSVLGM